MSYKWHYISAKRKAEQASYHALETESKLAECRNELQRLRRRNVRLTKENNELKKRLEELKQKLLVKVWQYGSNMDEKRLNSPKRLRGCASFYGLAVKRGYRLAFTHTNKFGVGASDIVESNPNDYVIGCLFDIPKCMMPILDRVEGVNSGGYKKLEDFVVMRLDKNLNQTSERLVVTTYVVANKENNPKTNSKYGNHILQGIKDRKMGMKYFNKVKEIILENNPDIEEELIDYTIASRDKFK